MGLKGRLPWKQVGKWKLEPEKNYTEDLQLELRWAEKHNCQFMFHYYDNLLFKLQRYKRTAWVDATGFIFLKWVSCFYSRK
jgi:hypothetical protein